MHFRFRGKSFTTTLDITRELLDNGIIIADLPNIDFMKASLLCFVENFRTYLNIPDLEPSGYVIVDPFTEFPAHFVKLPKEEQIVLIGWMAFFLNYIDHAVKKEYFLSECVNGLYVGESHISKYRAHLKGYLNDILRCDPSLIGIYDH